jgi:hypothetical protein
MESGYVSPEAWRLALISGRRWSEFDSKTNDRKEFAYVESISQLEDQLDVAKRSFDACGSQKPDPNISAVEEWVEGHRARTRRAAVGGNDATRIQTRDQVVMNPASLIR